jgi:hypothetical protein
MKKFATYFSVHFSNHYEFQGPVEAFPITKPHSQHSCSSVHPISGMFGQKSVNNWTRKRQNVVTSELCSNFVLFSVCSPKFWHDLQLEHCLCRCQNMFLRMVLSAKIRLCCLAITWDMKWLIVTSYGPCAQAFRFTNIKFHNSWICDVR